ncbi:MAG: SocA family protein [Tissierellia bacterium]|nr:SocA family protein [Tissierellia bacterium]
MIAYKKEKLNNAICYFTNEVYKRRREYLPQTLLYKFLTYLDFISIERTGIPALELKYYAYQNGPVPVDLYQNKSQYETDCFRSEARSNNRFIFISKKEADLSYFSDLEIGIMNDLLNKYIRKDITMKDIIDNICNDSHKDIKAWEVAYKREKDNTMNYGDIFEGIDKKKFEDLSINEERFLVYSALKDKTICN